MTQDTFFIRVNEEVQPAEVVSIRGEVGTESTWQDCLRDSLCVVTARDANSNELLGIGFLVGNARRGEFVDLVVKQDARKQGIGGKIVEEINL